MDIYLIRHGETDYNVVKRLQGTIDIPLNAYGIELAEKTSEALKDIPFDLIFSSPLSRAYRTAEIIRRDRPIEIIKTDGLLEISFGEYEGMICKGENYNIPDPDFKKFFEKPDEYVTAPGGESISDMIRRTHGFLRSVMDDPEYQDKTILMASHGAAIRGMLSGLQNLPVSQFWSTPVHRNCGVTKLHVENGAYTIEFENRLYY